MLGEPRRIFDPQQFVASAMNNGSPPFLLKMVSRERQGASRRSFSPTPASSALPLTQASNTNGGEPEQRQATNREPCPPISTSLTLSSLMQPNGFSLATHFGRTRFRLKQPIEQPA